MPGCWPAIWVFGECQVLVMTTIRSIISSMHTAPVRCVCILQSSVFFLMPVKFAILYTFANILFIAR